MTLTRRDFLHTAAVSAGTTTWFLPQWSTAVDAPASDKLRIASIGIGGQGNGNLTAFMKNVVAVCDVDSKRLATAQAKVEKANGKCAAFADYRKLLDSKDIDAVVVSTPDHWHAKITIDACNAGKHVYCEKPLTLFVAEGRAIVNAARKNKRIVQTGSQQRSSANFRQASELVRSGYIGTVEEVKVGIPGPNFKGPPVADAMAPAELDYDLWLGPAPKRPYNEKRVHYLFRFFWDYSGGQMTNWGAHHLDIAQWGLGMDESGPISVEGKANFHKDMWYETPEKQTIVYTYANGVRMTCGMGEKLGTTFIGDKGTIHVNRGVLTSDPVDLIKTKLVEKDVHLTISSGHHKNWLECIASGKLPICDAEIGHRSATICHLGNIACRLGRKIPWDPVKETCPNDKEAAAMLTRPYREPWVLG